MSNDIDTALNIRFLCSRHGSVSEACRKIGINRQQFNKYLNGTHQPSLRTASKITSCFDLKPGAIFLPHEQFVAHLTEKTPARSFPTDLADYISGMDEAIVKSRVALEPYCGNYFLYYKSPSWPDGLVRSFLTIRQRGFLTYSKTVDRLFLFEKRSLGFSIQKCTSLVHMENDRIYMVDRNSNRRPEMSMMILLPTHRSQIRLVYGLQMSVTSSGARLPYASRVVLQRLEKGIELRSAMKECAIFPHEHHSIDPIIWKATHNEIREDDAALMSLTF